MLRKTLVTDVNMYLIKWKGVLLTISFKKKTDNFKTVWVPEAILTLDKNFAEVMIQNGHIHFDTGLMYVPVAVHLHVVYVDAFVYQRLAPKLCGKTKASRI